MNPGALVPIVIVSAFGAVGFTEFPRNDLPQPYRTTRDWGQLPPGVKWAAVTAIEPAPDGTIYVIHRCFANSCAGRPEAPILKYDASGHWLYLTFVIDEGPRFKVRSVTFAGNRLIGEDHRRSFFFVQDFGDASSDSARTARTSRSGARKAPAAAR